jgi:type IV secretion system protein VirB6
VTYALVLILAAAVSGLLIQVLGQFYNAALADANTSGIEFAAFAPIAITCVMGLLLMPQILGIASALGGGVSLSTLGAPGFAKDAIKGAPGFAKGAAGKTAGAVGAVGGAVGALAKRIRPANTVAKA